MVQTGKTVVPTAFSITYLEARDEDSVQTVREGSRATMLDMLKMDGFIGATTVKTGHRMVTISAWEDTESPRELMRRRKRGCTAARWRHTGSPRSGQITG